jgi:peroxiredoxin
MNKLWVALAAVILLAGCKSKDATNLEGGEVTIKGTIAGMDSGYLELIVPSRENQKIDSIKIEKAAFEYEIKVKEPELMVLRLAGMQGAEMGFFADAGTIKITAVKDSLWTSKVEGGPTQVLFKEMETQVRALMQKAQAMYPAYMQAQQSQDMAALQRITDSVNKIQVQAKELALGFAKKNRGSVIAPYLGILYLADPTSTADAKSLYDTLSPEAKKTFFGKKLSEMVTAAAALSIGSPAPEFTMATPDGQQVSLSSFKGQYVLLDFWAAWCGPCREENPNVVKAYETYKDKGFTVLGVSLDQDRDAWTKAIADDKLAWTQVSDLQYWNSAAAKLYKVQSIPANFLLDKEGKIIGRDLRGPALQERLAALLK